MSSPPLITCYLLTSIALEIAPLPPPVPSPLRERLSQFEIRIEALPRDANPKLCKDDGPVVLVSVGGDALDYPGLWQLPLADRRHWLHFSAAEEITAEALIHCWLAATDPLPEPGPVPASILTATPLVSVFTACYNPGKRILRPFRSLQEQTYTEWEWVIVDDTGDEGTGLRNHIGHLPDPRVRSFFPDRHRGYIGTMKRLAATLCRGEILVELDHDDELTPDCLQRLVDAFRHNPEAGFAFGEATEIYEETGDSHWYGWDAGFGYLSYWRQPTGITGRLVNVPRTPGTNWQTVRHLVGLPNHPRAWTRAAYFAVGGHRPGLPVADDYDLMLRTLLCTRMVRVPYLLYLQYRNAGGENQTFVRNRQIQILCGHLEEYYRPRIESRLRTMGLPELDQLPYRRIWTCAADDPRWVSAELRDQSEPKKISHLFVYPFEAGRPDTTRLIAVINRCNAANWQDREVVVVGWVPEGLLEGAARRAPPGAIRWWATESSWPTADHMAYGRLLCSGLITMETGVEDIAVAEQAQNQRLPLQYVDVYAPYSPADQGRDRLTVLQHLRLRFGYQRYLEIGTDRDEVFAQMNGFDLKVGVDPNAGGTQRMTSDAYFAINRARDVSERDYFDLVLIDGLHEHEQVLRDVDHALECLLPGGTLVLHDCMPFEERQQIVPRPQPLGFWTGDVWKAVFLLRQRFDLDVAVGCFDWGVGVVRVRPNSRPFAGLPGTPTQWTWNEYLAVWDEGLNPMSFESLSQWIDGYGK